MQLKIFINGKIYCYRWCASIFRYKEACSPGYQFGDASAANEGTGHFTQVVWKGSTILGIGRFTKETKRNGRTMYCTYIVARYRPAGNWQGQYAENVIKGTFSPTKTCENLNKILADVKGNRKSHAHLSRNKPAKSGEFEDGRYCSPVDTGKSSWGSFLNNLLITNESRVHFLISLG